MQEDWEDKSNPQIWNHKYKAGDFLQPFLQQMNYGIIEVDVSLFHIGH